MDEITLARTHDPGRGAFCAVTKHGVPLNFPPNKREPIVNRQTNPRGVRHPNKTQQDYLPVDQRPRVAEAKKRLARMRAS